MYLLTLLKPRCEIILLDSIVGRPEDEYTVKNIPKSHKFVISTTFNIY